MDDNRNLETLDRILLEQDRLLPSSGFAASVMDAIRQQDAAPAPIPFPWTRAIPGFAVLLVGFVLLCWLTAATIRGITPSMLAGMGWLTWLRSSTGSAVFLRTQAGPALIALAVSFVCVTLCQRLTAGWSTR